MLGPGQNKHTMSPWCHRLRFDGGTSDSLHIANYTYFINVFASNLTRASCYAITMGLTELTQDYQNVHTINNLHYLNVNKID